MLAPDDSVAYIDERNSHDVAIVRLGHRAGDRVGDRAGLVLAVDGVIPTLNHDPMPAELRAGQHADAQATDIARRARADPR